MEAVIKNKWDLRFIKLAEEVGSWSKDLRTRVGSIIADDDNNPISMGYNGFARKIDDSIGDRYLPENKLKWTIHSEANAIINCARHNQCTVNTTMYVTLFPCNNCAGMIVNAGIKRVVCKNKPDFNNEKWGESWKISKTIFEEAGVEVTYINE
jgi:dCMP deaminase